MIRCFRSALALVALFLVSAVSMPTDAAQVDVRPAAAVPRGSGPALTVPAASLRRAVRCDPQSRIDAAKRVVLLVHGTGSTPAESFSWGYVPALHADGFAICTVQLPGRALASFTRSAEYVVGAVRRAHRLSGRGVAIVGHSQGGPLGLWAVTFWPDVSRDVTDIVSIAGPMHGTALADELCAGGRCAPLAWQLRRGSATLHALLRHPLVGRNAITSIASRNDEIVRPEPAVSHLRGASNIVAQDVCAADPSEHGLILGDPVTYAIVLDALNHRGPARASRVPAATCTQTFIPHGDLAASAQFGQTLAHFTSGLADPRRWVDAEPAVPAYAR